MNQNWLISYFIAEYFGNGNNEIQSKDFSYASNLKMDNSFNKKNEIGAYFCGGSI